MAAGLRAYGYLNSNVLGQIKGTIIPLADPDLPFFNLMGASHFNNLVILVGTVTGLLYFFFSKDHTGNFGKVTRVGIYFLMISFGASFGFNVMGRISLLIGRFSNLIEYNDQSYLKMLEVFFQYYDKNIMHHEYDIWKGLDSLKIVLSGFEKSNKKV